MTNTASFRRQHDELLECATQIANHLTPDELVNNSAEARKLLSNLSGKLRIHLAMEDQTLYPELLKSQNAGTADAARRFQSEMGDIADVFKDYLGRWPTADAIKAKPDDYGRETRAILDALGKRIERENGDLYRLADAE